VRCSVHTHILLISSFDYELFLLMQKYDNCNKVSFAMLAAVAVRLIMTKTTFVVTLIEAT